MQLHDVDACVITSGDPHISEYLPEHWQTRRWLSGFTGSVGTLVVTKTFVGLWVDSRYIEAAKIQVENNVSVQLLQPANTPLTWIKENIPPQSTVAISGQTISANEYRNYKEVLDTENIHLRNDLNLANEIWLDRPTIPSNAIYEHEECIAGESRTSKIARLREAMNKVNVDYHFVSSLDDIAWLLNLRGSDIPYNPLFMAHVLVGAATLHLFVDIEKIPPALRAQLVIDGIRVDDYEGYKRHLKKIAVGSSLLIDPSRIAAAALDAVAKHVKILEALNPTQLFKSRKSPQQIRNISRTMELDGAALCRFFNWLESTIAHQAISELAVDEKLNEFRGLSAEFISPSFATIAGFNENAAMPHYQATPQSYSVISGDGLLLIDSGGQYVTGTTDITRMVAIGSPSHAQRDDCTLVLKGLIALSRAHFPDGAPGFQIDALARAPLWEQGLDYGHGTGHGVGYFLNVHEGPQSISKRPNIDKNGALLEGMVTSIEPGIYRPQKWGVRIENLVVNSLAIRNEFGCFLRFETLTLCPIDVRCLHLNKLTDEEIAWLNRYHQEVRQRLEPYLDAEPLRWLKAATAEVSNLLS